MHPHSIHRAHGLFAVSMSTVCSGVRVCTVQQPMSGSCGPGARLAARRGFRPAVRAAVLLRLAGPPCRLLAVPRLLCALPCPALPLFCSVLSGRRAVCVFPRAWPSIDCVHSWLRRERREKKGATDGFRRGAMENSAAKPRGQHRVDSNNNRTTKKGWNSQSQINKG